MNFRQFAEYFTRTTIDPDETLPQGCCKACYKTILGFCMYTVQVEAQQNKFKNRIRPEELSLNQNSSTSSKDSSTSSTKRSRDDSEEPKETNGEKADPETRSRSKRKKNGDKSVQAINEIKYTDKKEKVDMVRDKN